MTGQGSVCHGSFRICALLPPCSRTPIEHGSPGIRLPLFRHICTERGLTALRKMQIVRQIEREWDYRGHELGRNEIATVRTC